MEKLPTPSGFATGQNSERRFRGPSIGMTEEAKASGNALDKPTSVWSILARKLVEPSRDRESK